MVKNTTGGTGTKSLARKHLSSGHSNELRLPASPLEVIACVTKALGNGMLQVTTNNNTVLIAHIRNKFRGKQKRHNMINTFSVVLIGLREWEKPYKNCDILTVYDSNQVDQLKNIPSIDIDNVVRLSIGNDYTSSSSKMASNDIIFSEDNTEEIDQTYLKFKEEFKLEKMEEIDIDEI